MPNIIIADDEILIRRAYTDILEDQGYKVTAFETGTALLKAFSELEPDLIILDVQMPGLDGISTCKEIRKLPNGKNIPIIIISGSCGRAEPNLISSGADLFIFKPVESEELINTIKKTLKKAS